MQINGTKKDLINKWKKRIAEIKSQLSSTTMEKSKIKMQARIEAFEFCITDLEMLKEK